MKKILLWSIRAYQKSRFLHHGIFKFIFYTDTVCRFKPVCSDYTVAAIEKYGVLKGLLLAIKRIVRCNPWSKGGFDPLS